MKKYLIFKFALIGLLRFLIVLAAFSFVSFIVGLAADYLDYFPPYLNFDKKDFFLNSWMGLMTLGASILPLIIILLVLFYLLFFVFSVLGGRTDDE